MPKLHGCCKYIYIYIKNHDFCTISIILLSFLLGINLSHIYNAELLKTNVYFNNCGYPESCISGGPQATSLSIMFDN